MFRISVCVCVFLLLACFVLPMAAQQPAAVSANVAVPPMVNFSGVLTDVNGKPLTGTVGVTFYLYKDSQGGAPLWMETQNVQADKAGHYTAVLGSTSSQGLPANVFVSGEARWLGVQIQGRDEQPRVLLMSVPYALKALDAETIGGKPVSSFMLAPSVSGGSAKAAAAPPGTITGKGTAGFIPVFTGPTTIADSKIFQTVGLNVGVGTATPAAKLDVAGTDDIRDTLTLFPKLAHPTLSVHGTAFAVSSTGTVTFVAGQTFPGTGTVTSVTAGAGLAGGTITKTGTISIATGGVTNTDLAHSSLTVNAGADLTGGGLVALGGATTLNLDTTKVPLLAAANTFTANQTVNGTLAATNFSGNGASVTNVNATALGGVAASGYPTLATTNFFTPGFDDFDGAFGVWEVRVQNSGGGNGIIANNLASSGTNSGAYAASPNSINGNGVFGQQGSESSAGSNFASVFIGTNGAAGVWGDGGTTSGSVGVIGTVDNGWAGIFTNTSAFDAVEIFSQNTSSRPFLATNLANGSSCNVDASGNINCTGLKNAIVPVDGGARTVGLAAIESPKAWFEDFGSAELVRGSAVVRLDAEFMQTVNTDREYQVFLTPYGDCKGLYVSNRKPNSFEVHELGGGTASLSFGYRITALRQKYEDVRFADHSHDLDQVKLMQKRLGMKVAPHPHTPNEKLQLAAPRAALRPTATKSQTR
jgi:hypothetical protein